MGVKGLAEGVILQSFEDLWNDSFREESIAFFRNRDFRTCAGIAGMNLEEQVKLLEMVKRVVDYQNRKKTLPARRKVSQAEPRRARWQRSPAASCG